MKFSVDDYKKLVLMYGCLQLALEKMTELEGTGLYKQDFKRKTNVYAKVVDNEIKKYVDKMYEDEEDIYVAIQNGVEKVLSKELEDIANG